MNRKLYRNLDGIDFDKNYEKAMKESVKHDELVKDLEELGFMNFLKKMVLKSDKNESQESNPKFDITKIIPPAEWYNGYHKISSNLFIQISKLSLEMAAIEFYRIQFEKLQDMLGNDPEKIKQFEELQDVFLDKVKEVIKNNYR